MKKILTSILLASATFTFGQSIHIFHDNQDVTGKVITVPISKDSEFVTEIALKNTTSSDIHYQVNRTIMNPPLSECSHILFCTGDQCYGPTKTVNWTPPGDGSYIKANQTLPDGPGTFGIAAHYKVCGSKCADLTVKYRVYRLDAGTKDTAIVTIQYTCTNGITEENASLGSLSDAYPNPASANFTVNYTLTTFSKSEIAVYDLFGKKLIETQLPRVEGSVTINTSSLPPGVYFYSLMVANQRAVTKRLVISE